MALTQRIQEALVQRCYVRREGGEGGGDAGAIVPTRGELDGWVYDPRLRCRSVRHEVGADPGRAEFDVIPQSGEVMPFEDALSRYGRNDQVKVVVDPSDDPGQADVGGQNIFGGGGDVGAVLFEGVMFRVAPQARGDARGGDEHVRIVAWPFPVLDNDHPDHLVRGRWRRVESEGEEGEETTRLITVETPSVPATFNFRGRRNRAADPYEVSIPNTDEGTIKAWDWARGGDDDPDAEYWTIGQAIRSLLATRLLGIDQGLNRHVAIERETLEGLASEDELEEGEELDARWAGLDRILPEVSIQGMGVLEALEAICGVSGYLFAVEPVSDAQRRAEGYDRRYVLRIWRRRGGRLTHFDLPARGSQFGSARQLLAAANMPRMQGVVDASSTLNESYAAAPVLIETTIPLKPMWHPEDLHDAEIDESLQTISEEDLEDADSYAGRHVAGGVAFDEFGYVGRAWGLDLVGGTVDGYGESYDEGESHDYFQPPEGFDWSKHFDIDEGSAITPLLEERATMLGGEPEDHREQLQGGWLRRMREILPLVSREAQERELPLLLEVSEDSGATWTPVPIKIQTLEERFGIRLDIKNLTRVSVATLGTDEDPEPEDSWWALIQDQSLRMRLTCCIEADFALRAEARRTSDSPVRYRRGQWRAPDVQDAWIAPGSFFASASEWARPDGAPQVGGDDGALAAYVAQRRDTTEQVRWALSANTFLMELDRWRLGDRINGVRGRNVVFECGGGRRPNIVGITYKLSGSQSIELTLSDQRMAGRR